MTKLNHEHRDLKEKLKEERKQTEELWKTKTELEDERRLQDRTVEQLQRKVMGGPHEKLKKICFTNPEAITHACVRCIMAFYLTLFVSSQMNSIMEECEASTDVLQNQVDEARERSQRELDELRRQLQEKGAELEKSRQAAKKLQEEVWCSFPF